MIRVDFGKVTKLDLVGARISVQDSIFWVCRLRLYLAKKAHGSAVGFGKSSCEEAYFNMDFKVVPMSAGLRAILQPAASNAANFASAVPLPPLMIAPA